LRLQMDVYDRKRARLEQQLALLLLANRATMTCRASLHQQDRV